MRRNILKIIGYALLVSGGLPLVSAPAEAAPAQLLNVSYDPTRELYAAINGAFAQDWKAKTGQNVTIRQSHGGSG